MSCLEKETSELKEAMEQQKGKNNVSEGACTGVGWRGREEAMGKSSCNLCSQLLFPLFAPGIQCVNLSSASLLSQPSSCPTDCPSMEPPLGWVFRVPHPELALVTTRACSLPRALQQGVSRPGLCWGSDFHFGGRKLFLLRRQTSSLLYPTSVS